MSKTRSRKNNSKIEKNELTFVTLKWLIQIIELGVQMYYTRSVWWKFECSRNIIRCEINVVFNVLWLKVNDHFAISKRSINLNLTILGVLVDTIFSSKVNDLRPKSIRSDGLIQESMAEAIRSWPESVRSLIVWIFR